MTVHNETAAMVQEALACAEVGWCVLPLAGKIPVLKDWTKLATTDPATITDWWTRRYPTANLGIAAGHRSNLFVVDVDPRHGGDDSLRTLEAQFGDLPKTIEVITGGGGRHTYVKHPSLPVGNSANALGPGLDVKTDGGQVVAPPILHPVAGSAYAWEADHHPNDIELAEVLPWLLAQLTVTKTPGAPFVTPETIGAAQRHLVPDGSVVEGEGPESCGVGRRPSRGEYCEVRAAVAGRENRGARREFKSRGCSMRALIEAPETI